MFNYLAIVGIESSDSKLCYHHCNDTEMHQEAEKGAIPLTDALPMIRKNRTDRQLAKAKLEQRGNGARR